MAITLNFTTIDDADDFNTWSIVGAAAGLADGGVPQQQGTSCVEFHLSSDTNGGIQSQTVTAFDLRDQEVGVWFLNPSANAAGQELIAESDGAVRLRVYAGANYAEYDQGHLRNLDGTFPGGWSYLRASGAAGTEDRNSGTWTNTQAGAITSIAVIVSSQNGNTSKNATEYAVDWAKYYDKIIVTGYDSSTVPYTFDDIYQASIDNSWGVVENVENFYSFYCGLELGDSTNPGALVSENEYILFDHSSPDHDYFIEVKNNYLLRFGEKNVQTDQTYAQKGCQLVATEDALFGSGTKVAPPMTVQNGGKLFLYDTLVQGFGTIQLGNGDSAQIEIIKSDLYDNDEVEFRSTALSALNIRLHHLSTDKGDLGAIYNIPVSLEQVEVFNCTDAINFQASIDVKEYVAGDTTYDLVVLEGETIRLVNSRFNETKIKRVT